jgi:hypothetical protein
MTGINFDPRIIAAQAAKLSRFDPSRDDPLTFLKAAFHDSQAAKDVGAPDDARVPDVDSARTADGDDLADVAGPGNSGAA